MRRLDEIRRILTTDLFDVGYYRATHPDVAQAGRNPRLHYARAGALEGRNPNALFDGRFYLGKNPEIRAAGVNPLYHYMRTGAREGRDPGPLFNTRLYLEESPGVHPDRVNPLAHFLRSLPAGQDPADAPFVFRSWLASYEEPGETLSLSVRRCLAQLPKRPRVSLLAAVPGDVDPASLEEMVESVRTQLYDEWELLIGLAPDTPGGIQNRLSEISMAEPRIRLVKTQSAEPATMLRDVATEARGDFVAVVDPDDRLDQSALFLLAEEVAAHPEAAVVYSDEDDVDPVGRRHSPHFKPGWSRDLLYGWNYLGRLVILERGLVEAVGGFTDTHAPSHEYDLHLRTTGAVDDSRIRHIPWILCHRQGGTAARRGGSSRPEEAESARRALADHLRRSGMTGTTEGVGARFQRVLHPLPDELPLVSVIIPTRDRLNLLKPCLSSLVEKTDYPFFEILVVDNESRDPDAVAFLRRLRTPHRVLEYEGPFNYSAINNFAVRRAEGSILVFLNNDTEIRSSSWLREMVRLAVRDDVGAVGARLLFPDDTVQHAGVIVGLRGVAGHSFAGLPASAEGYFGRAILTQEYSAVTGACLAMRRSVFEEMDGFDEEAFPVNFNDIDLCLRVRATGRKILFCPQAELVHHESASRPGPVGPNDPLRAERARFRARWPEAIEDDPFYNPNLSLTGRPFSLAVPPRTRWPWEVRRAAGPAQPGGTLDPYAAADNWSRAAAVEAQPPDIPRASRDWRPGLSVVILSLDRYELIGPLIDQLLEARSRLEASGHALQVIIGDTGSKDGRVLGKYEEHRAEITAVRGLRYHFSRCNNRLFSEHVVFGKVLFLNNDIIFADAAESLLALVREMDGAPDVGVVGAILTYPDGRVQHAGIDFLRSGPLRGLPYHPRHRQSAEALGVVARASDCPAVTGACRAIRSRLFADLGGFDEGYRTEGQDAALCLAAWRVGYRCRLVPAGRIDHLENATRPAGSEDWFDRQRFVRRWGSFAGELDW